MGHATEDTGRWAGAWLRWRQAVSSTRFGRLCVPRADGALRLVGVEYMTVALANTEGGHAPWFGPQAPPDGFSTPRIVDQWQHEVTGAGRIWYCIHDERRVVYLTLATVGHPPQTECSPFGRSAHAAESEPPRGNRSHVLFDSYVLHRRRLPPASTLANLDRRGGVAQW